MGWRQLTQTPPIVGKLVIAYIVILQGFAMAYEVMLGKTHDKTILMIEHNTDFIDLTGECFLYLDGGSLATFDTLAELQNSRLAADGYF